VQSGSFRLCHDVCEHQIQQIKEKKGNEDRCKKNKFKKKIERKNRATEITLRLQYSMISHQSSPNITPYNSDEENVIQSSNISHTINDTQNTQDTSILDASSALNTLGRIESISDNKSSMDGSISL